MGTFYIFYLLQTTVLASLARFIEANISVRAIRVVCHTVVHASVQFKALTLVHGVVEERHDALNGLSAPEVAYRQASQTVNK